MSAGDRTLVSLSKLELAYGRHTVLSGVHDGILSGEMICLVGSNGSGKSTLLRAIAGLHRPKTGSVFFEEAAIYGRGALPATERAKRIAVVLTDRVQTGYLTVEQVVALGRLPFHPFRFAPGEEDRAVIRSACNQTGVSELTGSIVSTLSDGQSRRVMIARALAQEPRLLLLDEPASYLDPPHQVDLFARLREMTAGREDFSVLITTHSIELALRFATRIWVLIDGKLRSGIASEMTAAGEMELAFPHPTVRFDRENLRFVPIDAE